MSAGWLFCRRTYFKFSAYEAEHGKVMEAPGTVREVIFLKGHISKSQLNEHLAYPNQILLIKGYGKVMEASKKAIFLFFIQTIKKNKKKLMIQSCSF